MPPPHTHTHTRSFKLFRSQGGRPKLFCYLSVQERWQKWREITFCKERLWKRDFLRPFWRVSNGKNVCDSNRGTYEGLSQILSHLKSPNGLVGVFKNGNSICHLNNSEFLFLWSSWTFWCDFEVFQRISRRISKTNKFSIWFLYTIHFLTLPPIQSICTFFYLLPHFYHPPNSHG